MTSNRVHGLGPLATTDSVVREWETKWVFAAVLVLVVVIVVVSAVDRSRLAHSLSRSWLCLNASAWRHRIPLLRGVFESFRRQNAADTARIGLSVARDILRIWVLGRGNGGIGQRWGGGPG